MRPIKKLQLGKNGLSEAFMQQIKNFFETERMIKIDILRSACRDKEEAKKIAETIIKTLGTKYNYKLIGYVMTITKFRKEQH
jgi:RNA-binding protein YhbY